GLDPEDPSDAAGDIDADGLSNLEEFRLGTLLDNPDSDDDGLSDGEEVAAGLDPLDPDTDGDGIADGSDPCPAFEVTVRFSGAGGAIEGGVSLVRVELLDPQGARIAGPALRFTLAAGPQAIFAAAAAEGTLLSGGGTDRVVVETTSGVAAIGVTPTARQDVSITLEDTEPIGIARFRLDQARYRVNCGCLTIYTDVNGTRWLSDRYVTGGDVADFGAVAIANTADPTIYRTERWGNAAYAFPVVPGLHVVILHFAEVWEGACPPEPPRIFNVDIEGARVLTDFNTVDDLGGWRVAGTRTFELDVADDRVNIELTPGSWGHTNPKISAIEILATSFVPPFRLLPILTPDGDDDGDLMTNAEEIVRETDPLEPDTDGDGLLDGFETRTGAFVNLRDAGTDPLVADSDGDGASDGLEVRLGTDPNEPGAALSEIAGDIILSGARLEIGMSAHGTMLTEGGRGILLHEPEPAIEFLPDARSHDAMALRFVDTARATTVALANRPAGNALSFRTFDASTDDSARVIGITDPGSLSLRQEVRLGDDDAFVRFRITLLNTAAARLENVRYLRSIDPTIDDRIATSNDVIATGAALASAQSGATLLLGSSDLRAVLSCEGQVLTNPDLVIASPVDPGRAESDVSLNIAFSLGDLDPGEEASFEFLVAAAHSSEAAEWLYLLAKDRDGDGIPDVVETRSGLDPNDPSDGDEDFDGDGLSNREEHELGIDVRAADTDGDGIPDGDEIAAGCDPANPDSDGDGLEDGEELVIFGTDPLDEDSDDDGHSDGLEFLFGGDPLEGEIAPVLPGGIDFEGLGSLSELEGFSAGALAGLADGRAQLPSAGVSGVGSLFSDERVTGDFLHVSFDLEVQPGASGHGDGIAIALVGAPSPASAAGACCGGMGIGGLQYPTLAVEIDLTEQTGDPPGAHVGVDYFPDGVPPAEDGAVPSQATAPLPVDIASGGVFRFAVELAGQHIRVYFEGGAKGSELLLSHRVGGYVPIAGYAGLLGSTPSASHGAHAVDNLLIASHGPVALDGVLPACGPIAGGTQVALIGSGFTAPATLLIGAAEAEIISLGDSRIEAASPPGEAVGPHRVYIFTAAGGSRLRNGFTYTPYVRAVVPDTGPATHAVWVTLLGDGFTADEIPAIAFGESGALEVDYVSASVLRVLVPAAQEGLVDVSAEVAGHRATLSRGYRYLPAVFVPGDAGTIQEAIDLAPPQGLVLVGAGEYPESVTLGAKPLEVRSLEGPARTTIAGSRVRGPVVRVVAGWEATLRGFTVGAGLGLEGSGIWIEP
ncbi:MAG: IPT/TIG domain-containing protein, partial [Planctomycetes bacterium]|nr:IPT/TIG domain-containing protein [Planctomycetota bacterium]